MDSWDPLDGDSRYQMRYQLRSGPKGFVNLYMDMDTGEDVAVKFIRRGDPVNAELAVLNHRSLRHPHVIESKVFLTDKYIAIAMEYANGGRLADYVHRHANTEAVARWFFQQVILAVDYCHRQGISDRYLGLENILLQNYDSLPMPMVKLCAFGMPKPSIQQEGRHPDSQYSQARAYMSPEGLQGAQHAGKTADIWTCGIVLHILLFGRHPCDAADGTPDSAKRRRNSDDPHELFMAWIADIERVEVPGDAAISAGCRDLLTRMLTRDPSQRLSIVEIQQHPWFLDNLPETVLQLHEDFCSEGNSAGDSAALTFQTCYCVALAVNCSAVLLCHFTWPYLMPMPSATATACMPQAKT